VVTDSSAKCTITIGKTSLFQIYEQELVECSESWCIYMYVCTRYACAYE